MSSNKNDLSGGTIIEFDEPLLLLELHAQWDAGDLLAFTESVAICHAKGWPFPAWVNEIIGESLTAAYNMLFPDIALESVKPGLFREPRALEADEKTASDIVKKARSHVLERMGLQAQGAQLVERRRNIRRDLWLAERIAEQCRFTGDRDNPIDGEREARVRIKDQFFSQHGTKPNDDLRATLPVECREMSDDMVDKAWKQFRQLMIWKHTECPDPESPSHDGGNAAQV